MPKAWNQLRTEPWYRRQAFDAGLKANGFQLMAGTAIGAPGDVLLIWNRYFGWHDTALEFERRGGTVLVAENGYIGAGGSSPKYDVHPHGPKPGHYYALSASWHNGRGRDADGGPERLNALGLQMKPWRTAGGHVLVCPNRSFGVGEQVMPADWAERAASALRRYTRREIRVRAHPGNNAPQRSVAEDLAQAWCLVIWSSSCGVHALVAGVPVICMAPYWICKAGAYDTLEFVETERPELDLDRDRALERMAWAQWTVEEIASGDAFRAVLSAARQGQVPAPV